MIYLAPAVWDRAAAMAARVPIIEDQLRQSEIQQNIASVLLNGRLAVTTTQQSTAVQNFAALRQAYLTALRVEAIMIGDFLGSLTDAQLQTAFSMTASQVTTLRSSKLTPAANAATTIRAATGA